MSSDPQHPKERPGKTLFWGLGEQRQKDFWACWLPAELHVQLSTLSQGEKEEGRRVTEQDTCPPLYTYKHNMYEHLHTTHHRAPPHFLKWKRLHWNPPGLIPLLPLNSCAVLSYFFHTRTLGNKFSQQTYKKPHCMKRREKNETENTRYKSVPKFIPFQS